MKPYVSLSYGSMPPSMDIISSKYMYCSIGQAGPVFHRQTSYKSFFKDLKKSKVFFSVLLKGTSYNLDSKRLNIVIYVTENIQN